MVGTGSTDPAALYGIKVDGAQTQGVAIAGGSTDFDVAWIEVTRAGFAGIMAKSDSDCARLHTWDSFTQRNTRLHHNYIHHTNTGEAFYVGYFKGGPVTKDCDGQQVTLYPH